MLTDPLSGEKHYSAATAVENASSTVDVAMKENAKNAKKGGGTFERGTQAFATRVDLKSLMELIVSRVGMECTFKIATRWQHFRMHLFLA